MSKEEYLLILNDKLLTLNTEKKTSSKTLKHTLNDIDNNITDVKQLIQNVKNTETKEDVLELYLRAHDVDITEGLNNWTEINSWTSMFNDYNDVPKELKQILLFLMFEHPEIKMICKQQND
jgi:hypothetical protein